jgi:DNA-binding NtrC family response regulator
MVMGPTDRRSAATNPARGKRARAIVVVEGDRRSSEFLGASLASTEYDVVYVSTLEGALREVRGTVNVVAVVDDDLPLVRGLDLLGRLRLERPDLESVLMTRDEGVVSFAARLNVERFRALKKPMHLDDLRACVLQSVERLRARERPLPDADGGAKSSESGEHAALRRRVEALERFSRNASQSPPAENGETAGASEATNVDEEPPVEAVGEVVDPNALRVLVVDDDPLVRNAMARTFKRHHVTVAENGRAAAEQIERSKPDIIISDLKMPEMDGIELAEHIQERWPELSSRIVFVSGTTSQIERARKVAPQQPLLTKPVSSKQLEQRIAEVLEAAIRRR